MALIFLFSLFNKYSTQLVSQHDTLLVKHEWQGVAWCSNTEVCPLFSVITAGRNEQKLTEVFRCTSHTF